MSRAETGPMRFEGDWNGLFIRGDDALMRYLPAVRWAIEKLIDGYFNNPDDVKGMVLIRALSGFEELLDSVDQTVEKDVEVTLLKPFEHCVKASEIAQK